MNLRKAAAFLTALGLSLTFLSGCGKENSSASGSSDVSQSVDSAAEKTPETDEEWHDAMLKKALFSYGNTGKMQEKIKKAQSGEEMSATSTMLNSPDKTVWEISTMLASHSYKTALTLAMMPLRS